METNQYITLSQLANTIKLSISKSFPMGVWVKAEISQMSVNQTSGHCYMTLIEKSPRANAPVAKINANLWRSNFERIRWEFEQMTNTPLRAGIEVVAFASVDYSPIYGLSVNITKIDATFNLGQLAKQRQENIEQLKREGIFGLNKELQLPTLPYRLAVISSATAAGYEDFINQLESSEPRYPFRPKLFHCLMQGDKAPESVVAALNEILDEIDDFDCVVIIRGGGATTDLLAFDDLEVARVCAQYPLPILTGIGHTRDESIVDIVAHSSLKTPTAVAAFLISMANDAREDLLEEVDNLRVAVKRMLDRANNSILLASNRLPQLCQLRIASAESRLQNIKHGIMNAANRRLQYENRMIGNVAAEVETSSMRLVRRANDELLNIGFMLKTKPKTLLREELASLNHIENVINFTDPINILKKGFTYTEQDGTTITSSKDIKPNAEITTYFSDGKVVSVVKIPQ